LLVVWPTDRRTEPDSTDHRRTRYTEDTMFKLSLGPCLSFRCQSNTPVGNSNPHSNSRPLTSNGLRLDGVNGPGSVTCQYGHLCATLRPERSANTYPQARSPSSAASASHRVSDFHPFGSRASSWSRSTPPQSRRLWSLACLHVSRRPSRRSTLTSPVGPGPNRRSDSDIAVVGLMRLNIRLVAVRPTPY
jgi:hypothetical protein